MYAEDERAIISVLVRYATAIDQRNWTLLASCFAERASMDYGDFGQWNDCRSFVDHLRQGHENWGPTLHRLSNFEVSRRADEAVARCYVDALLMPRQPGGVIRRAEGRYEDQLLQTGGEWKIRRRKFVLVLMSESCR